MVKKLVLQIGDDSESDKKSIDDLLDINNSLVSIVTTYKDKITQYYQNKSWDKYKKLSNEYELIFYSSNPSSTNISLYNPVSRSFFKLWEILQDFDTELRITLPQPLKCVFLAEGPGGFFEAFCEKRKNNIDYCYGMTLKSCNNKMIPDWKTKTNNIHISYGKDGTGNIYNIDNLNYFINQVGLHTVDFITADGGFDFSSNFNNQEEQSFRLIVCEVFAALKLQNKEGNFLLKVYDCFNIETLKLIHILKACYKDLNFIKPLTSRPANSERYILCTGFKVDTSSAEHNQYVTVLSDVIVNYEFINLKDAFASISLEIPLLDNIVMYNLYYTMRQVYYIQRTINYINFFNKKNEETVANAILAKHQRKSINWCKKYNIPYREPGASNNSLIH